MERAEAEQLRDRLKAEHPDRETHSFILSESDGEWTVAKVALPPELRPSGTLISEHPPLHDHEPNNLPGGVPPNAVGGF